MLLNVAEVHAMDAKGVITNKIPVKLSLVTNLTKAFLYEKLLCIIYCKVALYYLFSNISLTSLYDSGVPIS